MRGETVAHDAWSAYGSPVAVRATMTSMQTGAIFRKRALAVVALALSTSASVAAVAGDAAASSVPGRTCVTETFTWTGTAMLDVGTTGVITDLVVPVVAGTDLVVVGVSADGLTAGGQARAMGITVGDVAAVPGAAVPGGAVTIVGDGAVAEVRGITVVVDRCATVQSVAPGTGRSLPHTGLRLDGSLFGAAAVAVGAAMIIAGRRRAAA
jgi:hypothetical protein